MIDFKELISEGDKSSMMRFTVLITLIIAIWLGLVLGIILLYKGYEHKVIDWTGASVFVGAIAALITGAAATKAYQKKHENKTIDNGESTE